MQAVAWIMTRDFRMVLRASLDEADCKKANDGLPDNDYWADPCRPGASKHNLDLRIIFGGVSSFVSSDEAVRDLVRALQEGAIAATGERYSHESDSRRPRGVIPKLFWAGLTFDDAPGDDRKLVPFRQGEISQYVTGSVMVPDWQVILFQTKSVFEFWPDLRSGSSKSLDQAAGSGPVIQQQKARGRKSPGLDYRALDRSIVLEGAKGVQGGVYRNPTDAARALAQSAAGHGTEASKVTRLLRQIKAEVEKD